MERNDSQSGETSRTSAGFLFDDRPLYESYVPMLFKQMWGAYDSALYMENISDTTTANITVKFYDVDGALICTKSDTSPAIGVLDYWLPDETHLPEQWYGGVVITSDQPVVSVGRPHRSDRLLQIVYLNGYAQL